MRRLVEHRGMPEADARARDRRPGRRRGTPGRRRRLAGQLRPAARRSSRPSTRCGTGGWCRSPPTSLQVGRRRGAAALVDADPEWPAQAARLAARVAAAAGERGRGVAHVGSTAVPGLPAPDVLDLQLGVAPPDDADALRDPLADAGFVRAGPGYASADPGRPARLHVRVVGSPGWRYALLLRDWLRADAGGRAEYAAAERRSVAAGGAELRRPGPVAVRRRGRGVGRIVGVDAAVERDEPDG